MADVKPKNPKTAGFNKKGLPVTQEGSKHLKPEERVGTKASRGENKILDEHLAEAARKKASIHNLGWATGSGYIHSKTDKGYLLSEMGKGGKVSHTWTKPRMPSRGTSDGYHTQGNPTAADENIA